MGQAGSFADNSPDTVDFNTMLGGLGAALRRNPRVELLNRYPLAPDVKFVSAIGFERPFFGNDSVGTDLGPGDLSGFPAVSGGVGLEADRLGSDFGIGNTMLYVRTTWGEFQERFTTAAIPASAFGAQTNFRERDFTNQAVHGTLILFSLAYNHTLTHFKRVNALGGSESRENENNKVELITWFSF